jgi:hypothetical protein
MGANGFQSLPTGHAKRGTGFARIATAANACHAFLARAPACSAARHPSSESCGLASTVGENAFRSVTPAAIAVPLYANIIDSDHALWNPSRVIERAPHKMKRAPSYACRSKSGIRSSRT